MKINIKPSITHRTQAKEPFVKTNKTYGLQASVFLSYRLRYPCYVALRLASAVIYQMLLIKYLHFPVFQFLRLMVQLLAVSE